MRKSWLVCVWLGTSLAWGQAAAEPPAGQIARAQGVQTPNPAPGAAQTPGVAGTPQAEPKPQPKPEDVPDSAAVITIHGLCPATTTATEKTGAKPAIAAKKTGAASADKKDCVTVITKAEFEKMAAAISPNPTPQFKRQLANSLPRFMAMSQAAKAKGLDKTAAFNETVKFAKMQILTTELQRSIQDQAGKVPDSDIEKYYKENPEAYEQFSLDRLFIPRFKQISEPPDADKDESKLTEEQQKAKEAEEQAKQAAGEQEMNKLAESLQERAAKGEDFLTLQKEAFAASGMKVESPTVNLPKVRRTGLPPAHAAAFSLKQGEVSSLISDNGGHYVYKVVSKEVLPLDQVKEEIRNQLKSQRMRDMMEKYQDSFKAETNEEYFGPLPQGPQRPGMPGGPPPRLPHPRVVPGPTAPQGQAQPPAQNAPAQPAAPAPPQQEPPKPN